MKFALVIDKSQAFISFHRERIFEAWGVEPQSSKRISRVQEAGGATLFGESVTSMLTLDDAEAVKAFVASVEKMSADQFAQKVSAGLFVSTSIARTSTKKLESLVAKLGGEVITTATPKGEKTSVAERLISGLKLNRDAKSFLLAYVGDDYEAVIPLVRTLSKLSPDQQANVSESDLYVRLPQPPGSVPPWEVEKPLLAGDLTQAIDLLRRVNEHSSFLVVLKMLSNKFQASYRISALLTDSPRLKDDELANATGVNPKQIWLYKKNHSTYGTVRLQEVVRLLADADRLVKGGSSADKMAIVESTLVRISLTLKSR